MSDSISFRGALIRYIDVRQGKEGGDVFCRIHMSASWSDQVREKMDWETIPDSITECKLTGSLLATNFILTPGDKQLKQYELNFDINSVEDFQVKSEVEDGEVVGRRLDFIVRTPKEVEGFLGNYIRRVGRHEGVLKIGYTVQEELPLEDKKATAATAEQEPESEGKDTGCISCNNGLPFEDTEKTTHANGMKCTRRPEPTLASAREANGGTHAKKRQQRRQPQPEAVDETIAEAEAAAEAEVPAAVH